MRTERNKLDIELLQNDPSALLTHYQPIVESVVASFIRKGYFAPEDKMDIVQNINTQLLEKKLSKIKEHFNGSVYLTTYFSKVVYNSCLEINRSNQRKPHFIGDEVLQFVEQPQVNAWQKMAIKDELVRLDAILKSFYKKKDKTRISLKLFAKILLSDVDLGIYKNPLAANELAMVRTTFYCHYDTLTDKEIFKIIVLLFNKIENKKSDSDSLRKWVQMLADKIIRLLNGDKQRTNYERETLKTLLQLYYQPST